MLQCSLLLFPVLAEPQRVFCIVVHVMLLFRAGWLLVWLAAPFVMCQLQLSPRLTWFCTSGSNGGAIRRAAFELHLRERGGQHPPDPEGPPPHQRLCGGRLKRLHGAAGISSHAAMKQLAHACVLELLSHAFRSSRMRSQLAVCLMLPLTALPTEMVREATARGM